MSDDRVRREGRFSSTEAAFTGFRLLAREPVTAAVWAGLVLAFSVGAGVLTVLTVGPAMTEFISMDDADPASRITAMARLLPLYLILAPLSFVCYAVAFGAVNRAVLRPEARGLAYLRLGKEELRQLGVLALYWLVVTAVYIVLLIGFFLVRSALSVLTGGGALRAEASSTAGLVGLVLIVAIAAVMIFLSVRLSLCMPLTFDRGKISFRGSWRLTEGRFWALLGAYLLAGLTTTLLWLVLAVVVAAISAAVGGLSAAGVIFRPDMTSLSAYFAPLQLVWIVVSAALSAVWLAVLIGAPAGAYAQIRALQAPAAPTPPERGF